MSMESKTRKVEAHLQKYGTITSWEAILEYKATRLSAIIFNLRKKYDIATLMMEGNDGCRYAKYVLNRGEDREE